jgi:GNAT superfamily N-acetyltransferase
VTDTHLTIRQADGATQQVASDLLRRFFAEEGLATTSSRQRAGLGAMLDDPRSAVMLAQGGDDDEVVGIATASWQTSVEHARVARIAELYVAPAARRRGIATALVEAVAGWARTQGCSTLVVAVGPDGELSHGVAGFFAQRGFDDEYRKLLAFELSADAKTGGDAKAGGDATTEETM